MFSHTSRYSRIGTATYETPDGYTVTYVRRRFLPQGERLPLLMEVTVTDGDRLDLITSRALGDPEQFWRVADANNAMNPFELTKEAGATVRVPIPQVER